MPGSLSSPLTTRYRGHTPWGMRPHFRPAGNPAPPRPSSVAERTSSWTAPGDLASAAFRPSYPPVARKRSSAKESSYLNRDVTISGRSPAMNPGAWVIGPFIAFPGHATCRLRSR